MMVLLPEVTGPVDDDDEGADGPDLHEVQQGSSPWYQRSVIAE